MTMQPPTLGRERLSAFRSLVFERLRSLAREILEARSRSTSRATELVAVGTAAAAGATMAGRERLREAKLSLGVLGAEVLSVEPLVISVPGLGRSRRELFLIDAEAVPVTFVPEPH